MTTYQQRKGFSDVIKTYLVQPLATMAENVGKNKSRNALQKKE